MPRTARASQGGYCYHVLNRGNGRAEVFHKEGDYLAFVRLMGQACERLPLRVVGWCLMPNHVHVLVRPLDGHALPDILQSWKSYTAKAANRLLGRSGPFWQREYYDHVVRNEQELQRCTDYIVSNPARACLAEWPWLGEGNMERLVGADEETG